MSEKFCNECGLPFAEREELHGRIVLARKGAEAAGSQMLDMQQDSIALRTDRDALVRYVRAKRALRSDHLPEEAQDLVQEVRDAHKALSQELRDLIGAEDG